MRRVVFYRTRVFGFFAALALAYLAGSFTARAGEITPPYSPDAEIEQTLNQALQSDGAVGERAFKKLVERGADAEKAINWNMQRAASNQRAKWAELFARLNRGKVAYRVTLELKADGAGALELWSNRSALAECGRKNDRIHGRPETTYSVDDLKYNPYSRVELLKFFPSGDAVKHLEARVEQPSGDIEARGMIAFKNFESLSSFADQFDAGGYHMLTGGTLTDAGNIRTYSFRKPAETDRVLYEKNLMLFHTARWEFVFDFKGAIGRNNAHRTEGSKLIWTFNCYELLNGLASIQVSFDSTGLPPRTVPPAAILGDAPQASVKNSSLNVKVFRRGAGPLPATKELRERGCLVELDGRESQPAGEGLQYRWRQTSGADLNIPTPDLSRAYLCLIVKEPGEYRFELVVSKNGIYSHPAEVKLFVTDDGASVAKADPKPQPQQVVTPPLRVPERAPEKKPEPPPAAPAAETKPVPKPVDLQTSDVKPAPVAPPPEKKPDVGVATPAEIKKPEVKTAPPVEPIKAAVPEKVATPEKKVPAGNPKELAAQGAAYLKGGNFTEAKRVLMQSLEISPDSEAQNNLGLALLELGEYPTAARQFEEVAQSSRSPKAMMNVGHSFARSGNLREAGNWYRRGASVGRDQVEWEPRWQLGNIELRDKNYKEALKLLKEAEAMASKVAAKDRDPRLYKDLAVAYLNNNQPIEALQSIKVVQDLGYTADPELVANVRKAAGGAAAPEVKAPDVAKVEAPKTEPAKTETVKTEPAKSPAKSEPAVTEVKKPITPATTPVETTKTIATETKPKTEPKPEPAAVQKTPEPAKTEAIVTAPPPPKKKAEPKPLPPKRALPPIPSDFESALAGGKKALESATALTAQNTDASKLEAHYKYDEAEAMLRSAWAKKPGDEQTIAAFRDLAKHVGAIALVNNTQIRAKAGGLVVLDAEPSIGPKDKTLFYAWEQVEGDPLEVRPENLAQKRVGLKIRKPGRYRFDLAVSDGSKGGTPVSVTVEVTE